jgi:glycogen synthase
MCSRRVETRVLALWYQCISNNDSTVLCTYGVQGAIVYSNVVTTVSPTYAQEVRSEVICLPTFGVQCVLPLDATDVLISGLSFQLYNKHSGTLFCLTFLLSKV